jgi:simple sugar transport system permease protein
MQAQVSIPVDIVTVMQALIVIFIAAPRLTRAIFRLRSSRSGALNTSVTNLAVAVTGETVSRIPRRFLAGGAEVAFGIFGIWAFALGPRSAHPANFQLSLPGAAVDLGGTAVQARPVALVLCALVVLAGVARIVGLVSPRLCAVVAVTGLVVSFIVWSVASSENGLNVVSLLQGAIFPAAIPLVLGAMAGLIGERAGVVNVAIEGQLLLGAFVAALVGTIAASAWVGAFAGLLGGLLVGALLAVLAIRYLVDQVIVGVVLNLFVLGLTTFLYSKVLQPHSQQFNEPAHFHVWAVPGLSDIPVLGPVFFDGTIFLYLTYIIVIATHFGLFHTRWGLRVRAVGEHPRAADTVGIDVHKTRYRAVWLGACIAGLGGAFLVLGTGAANSFQINMSSGRGFIALAAVIFGKWSPKGAVLAALLFGFSDQLQVLLQQADSPIDSNLLLMVPYVVTLFAVAGFIGRARPPAADGQPYTVGG